MVCFLMFRLSFHMFCLNIPPVIQVIVLLAMLRSILFNLKVSSFCLWWDSVLAFQDQSPTYTLCDFIDLNDTSSVLLSYRLEYASDPGPSGVRPWNWEISWDLLCCFWSSATNIVLEISTLWLPRRVFFVNYPFSLGESKSSWFLKISKTI